MEIIIKTRELNCPIAYLFCNGNAAYFDELENQIARFQTFGWKGLHLFRKDYPKAKVIMQLGDPVHPEVIDYLLENIIDPTEEILSENELPDTDSRKELSNFLNEAYEFKKTEMYEKMPLLLRDTFNQEIGKFEYIMECGVFKEDLPFLDSEESGETH